jgi:hypothetical protein
LKGSGDCGDDIVTELSELSPGIGVLCVLSRVGVMNDELDRAGWSIRPAAVVIRGFGVVARPAMEELSVAVTVQLDGSTQKRKDHTLGVSFPSHFIIRVTSF